MNKATKGKKLTGFKRTGNIAVDMVAACMDHYAKFGKRIEFISLKKSLWLFFCAYVTEKIPGYDFSDGTVNFDGVTIREGSSLQVTALYVDLVKVKKKEDEVN